MTKPNERLSELRHALHEPLSPRLLQHITALVAQWPEDDEAGLTVAQNAVRERVVGWYEELSTNLTALEGSFPELAPPLRSVSVRLCGGDDERPIARDDDRYVDAVFRGEPRRLQRVVVEARLARPAVDDGPADGVVWLIAPGP